MITIDIRVFVANTLACYLSVVGADLIQRLTGSDNLYINAAFVAALCAVVLFLSK